MGITHFANFVREFLYSEALNWEKKVVKLTQSGRQKQSTVEIWRRAGLWPVIHAVSGPFSGQEVTLFVIRLRHNP